jgi:hypothetical protein
LGIGVTPSATWNSDKAIQIGDSSNTSFLSSGTTSGAMNLGKNAYSVGSSPKYVGNGYATNYYQSAGTHVWQTAASNGGGAGAALTWSSNMTLDASGNLSIAGAASTRNMFQVGSANSTLSGWILGNNSAGSGGIWSTSITPSGTNYTVLADGGGTTLNATTQIVFGISNAEKMRIDSSGNVGIGTSSPSGRLNLAVGASTSCTMRFTANNTGTGAGDKGRLDFYSADNSGTAYQLGYMDYDRSDGTGTASYIAWANRVAGTVAERMRIDSSGNLLVGTTSTSVTSGGYNFLINDGGTGYSTGYIGHITGCPSGYAYLSFKYAGTAIGTITQNGTTGVLYNLTSDYRLKNNAVALTGAKDFVMALQPKKWQWWDGSGEGVGFIAHEFMEVAKYSGNGKKDAVDSDGKPVYQSIQPSSSEVMANLVSFIQEQQALITALTARIETLEAK